MDASLAESGDFCGSRPDPAAGVQRCRGASGEAVARKWSLLKEYFKIVFGRHLHELSIRSLHQSAILDAAFIAGLYRDCSQTALVLGKRVRHSAGTTLER